MSSWLFNDAGRDYLYREYVLKGRSARALADELKTYPNQVIRALKLHEFAVRNRSEARKMGLERGHIDPPMLGRSHPESVCQKISNSIKQNHQAKHADQTQDQEGTAGGAGPEPAAPDRAG